MNLMEKYRARLGDMRGGTPKSGPPVDELLDFPMSELTNPLVVEADLLGGERIYLCGNETQAQEIGQAGAVCYLPGEIRSLISLQTGMGEARWKDYLSKIHEVKKIFRGSKLNG